MVVSVRSSSVRSAPSAVYYRNFSGFNYSATNINRRVRRDVKFTFLEDPPYCLSGGRRGGRQGALERLVQVMPLRLGIFRHW